jgi:hypothetical protein
MKKKDKKETKQVKMLKKAGWKSREQYLAHLYNKKKDEAKRLREALLTFARELGRKGGTARAKNLTAKQLSEIGRQAAAKRWAKKGGKS